MKKEKSIIVVVLLILAVTLTSCNPDALSGLGQAMRWMGNNIYGIGAKEANAKKAVAITDSMVADNKIDLSRTPEFVDSLLVFVDSPTQMDIFMDCLDDELVVSGDELRGKLSGISRELNLIDTLGNQLLSDMKIALNRAAASNVGHLSYRPTRRDVITVGVIGYLTDTLVAFKNGTATEEEVSVVAEKCLKTLRVTTEFSILDFFNDIDIKTIIEAQEEDERDDDGDSLFFAALNNTIRKVTELLTDGRGFTRERYQRFTLEAKALRASYEIMMIAHFPKETDNILLDIFTVDIDHGTTVDDFMLYQTAFVFSSIDSFPTFSEMLPVFLSEYLTAEVTAALKDIKNNRDVLRENNPKDIIRNSLFNQLGYILGIGEDISSEELTEGGQKVKVFVGEVCDMFFNPEEFDVHTLISSLKDIDPSLEIEDCEEGEEFSVIMNALIQKAMKSLETILDSSVVYIGTMGGILNDAGYNSIYELLMQMIQQLIDSGR